MQKKKEKIVDGPWSDKKEKKPERKDKISISTFYIIGSLALAIVSYFIAVEVPVRLELINIEIIQNVSILIRVLATVVCFVSTFFFIALVVEKLNIFRN